MKSWSSPTALSVVRNCDLRAYGFNPLEECMKIYLLLNGIIIAGLAGTVVFLWRNR